MEKIDDLTRIIKDVAAWNEDLAIELVNRIADLSLLSKEQIAEICVNTFGAIIASELDAAEEVAGELIEDPNADQQKYVSEVASEFNIRRLIHADGDEWS